MSKARFTTARPSILWADSIEQAADITTAAAAFADMGALSLTTPALPSGASLLFWFEASTFVPSTTDLMWFRLLLDGVEVKRRGQFIGNLGQASLSIAGKSNVLAAGAHTLKAQWRNTSGVNTVYCRPTGLIEGASLSLIVVAP